MGALVLEISYYLPCCSSDFNSLLQFCCNKVTLALKDACIHLTLGHLETKKVGYPSVQLHTVESCSSRRNDSKEGLATFS